MIFRLFFLLLLVASSSFAREELDYSEECQEEHGDPYFALTTFVFGDYETSRFSKGYVQNASMADDPFYYVPPSILKVIMNTLSAWQNESGWFVACDAVEWFPTLGFQMYYEYEFADSGYGYTDCTKTTDVGRVLVDLQPKDSLVDFTVPNEWAKDVCIYEHQPH
ncbi:hypothetical protein M3Y99_00765800 [Aphelenchoides fujianensis]|nr:hypothetical protein M3Y99_00765800 [Aphelenchoides fujianensis]